MLIKTDGIILKSFNYGDTSRIFSVFSRECGLVKLLAKGIRSGKNRKFTNAHTIAINSINYYSSKNSELHVMNQCEQAMPTDRIPTSIRHLNIAVFAAESLLAGLSPELPAPELYDATAEFYSLLNELPRIPFLLFLKHQAILAEALGYEIIIVEKSGRLYYDYASNAFIPNIYKGERLGIEFSEHETEIINKIDTMSLKEAAHPDDQFDISADEKRKFLDFFTKYFTFHLEKQFYYTVY